jgi:hypothetical protein
LADSRDAVYSILGSIFSVLFLCIYFFINDKSVIDLVLTFMQTNSVLDYLAAAYEMKTDFGLTVVRTLWCFVVLTGLDVIFFTSPSAYWGLKVVSKAILVVIAATITELIITPTTFVGAFCIFMGLVLVRMTRPLVAAAFLQTLLSGALLAIISSASQTNAADKIMSLLTIIIMLIGIIYFFRVITRPYH